MGQEFFINSQKIEDQIRTLLPSQGGSQAGFDLSASTQIIPIIDITESAEGSNLRSDLQNALDFACDFNQVTNQTTTLVTNTGFFRVFGVSCVGNVSPSINRIFLDDTSTTKTVFQDGVASNSVTTQPKSLIFDFIVFLSAGLTLKATSNSALTNINVSTRQVASIDGTITNPLLFSS